MFRTVKTFEEPSIDIGNRYKSVQKTDKEVSSFNVYSWGSIFIKRDISGDPAAVSEQWDDSTSADPGGGRR